MTLHANTRRTAALTAAILIVAGLSGGCTKGTAVQPAAGTDSTTLASAALSTTTATPAAAVTPTVVAAAPKKATIKKVAIADVTRQACLIEGVTGSGAGTTLTLDYLTWTKSTGIDGDWGEFGNQSTKLRTIPMAANAKVRVTVELANGSSQPFVTIPLSKFKSHLATHPHNPIDTDAWWVTVHDGHIIAIEEHWIP
ncbi:MAG: hypothetical protein Q7W30_09145 [Coriobacteriia bacterium]|nr:hypothetical protein [Coriobacteriia bacterium]